MTATDEFADPILASESNNELKQCLQYWERPCIFCNLQTAAAGKAFNKFRVIKRFKYYVSAAQTTDVDTTVGKIKECKIFVRHNKKLDYDWQNETVLQVLAAFGCAHLRALHTSIPFAGLLPATLTLIELTWPLLHPDMTAETAMVNRCRGEQQQQHVACPRPLPLGAG
eukprot:222582-Chlamydomonas_euryale.AAC.5